MKCGEKIQRGLVLPLTRKQSTACKQNLYASTLLLNPHQLATVSSSYYTADKNNKLAYLYVLRCTQCTPCTACTVLVPQDYQAQDHKGLHCQELKGWIGQFQYNRNRCSRCISCGYSLHSPLKRILKEWQESVTKYVPLRKYSADCARIRASRSQSEAPRRG